MKCLNILSALFAFTAAGLWFMSARVKTPDHFAVHVSRPEAFGQPMGGHPMFGEYLGQAHSQDFAVLADALKKQSRLSAWAASSAACAAALQAIALILV
jgi:hypothetical protein